ncbi:unnamed protein product [Rhizophagus irregularis]|nr:unnamed protein product [Rhizophagus irregularis]
MHIIPDEVKIEIKNKVKKIFPHINVFSIKQLVDVLALIWHAEELENGFSDSQSDPCFKLKMESSFFKINLPRGITDLQFKKTVSFVQDKIKENPGDVIVLAGVSGGGKTSTAFGIATQLWSIYIDFSPSLGIYGDHAGKELKIIKDMSPEFEDNGQQSEALYILDMVILSRGLLLLKMLIEKKISTPKEWLFAQLQMKEDMVQKILREKKLDVFIVNEIITVINACLRINRLTLIFDEAQVLCKPTYGEYKGSTDDNKKRNLLQAYIENLTHYPVTCLVAGTYMHIASGISLVTSVGKTPGLHAHIVLKLSFLSPDDVLQNLDTVINLTDVTPKTRFSLGYFLKGRPRNCASFVKQLILDRVSEGITKDQEIQKFLRLWFGNMSLDMAKYLKNACTYPRADQFNPETAIINVIRLRVFYDHRFSHVVKLLQHSIIPCQSPDSIKLSKDNDDLIYFKDSYKIKINTDLESYLVSGIEMFLLGRKKTLVDVFVDNIILLKDTSSIGNELDAIFITAMIQKRGNIVRDELDKWKNGQEFNLPSWITPTMRFMTSSNLSGSVPITEYIDNTDCYRDYGIQPDRFSGSDLVISLTDDNQSVVLLSASCTVSAESIKRSKIREQKVRWQF